MRSEMEEEAEKFLTENAVCGTMITDFEKGYGEIQ